jgi:hypothetical protein
MFPLILRFLLYSEEIPPLNYHEKYPFLSDDEKLIKVLSFQYRAVRLGRKLRKGLKEFSYGELREPLLTNKRFLLLKDDKIDYEIPISDIKSADQKMTGRYLYSETTFPYLIIETKNGETDLFTFVRASPKKHPSEYTSKFIDCCGLYLSPIVVRFLLKWQKTINELAGAKEQHRLKYAFYEWVP